jgi:hypothetical protein
MWGQQRRILSTLGPIGEGIFARVLMSNSKLKKAGANQMFD